MRRILGIAALVLATLCRPTQAANTWGTDFSDLWWNRSESGWGVNIAHQGDTIFMTLFVYGADHRVRWYVAPPWPTATGSRESTSSASSTKRRAPTSAGRSIPDEVVNRVVGDATIFFPPGSWPACTYTVDYVTQTKSIRTADVPGQRPVRLLHRRGDRKHRELRGRCRRLRARIAVLREPCR